MRLMDMTSRLNQPKSLELLQTEYRRAWSQFTISAEILQSALNRVPQEEQDVADARAEADRATDAYREARNALANVLLPGESESQLAPAGATRAA